MLFANLQKLKRVKKCELGGRGRNNHNIYGRPSCIYHAANYSNDSRVHTNLLVVYMTVFFVIYHLTALVIVYTTVVMYLPRC